MQPKEPKPDHDEAEPARGPRAAEPRQQRDDQPEPKPNGADRTPRPWDE